MKYLYAYRNIWIPSNLVTLFMCIETWRNDSLSVISMLVWIKIITTILLILYIHIFRQHVVLFFMNLGLGRMKFYSSMLSLDIMIYSTLVLSITILK